MKKIIYLFISIFLIFTSFILWTYYKRDLLLSEINKLKNEIHYIKIKTTKNKIEIIEKSDNIKIELNWEIIETSRKVLLEKDD